MTNTASLDSLKTVITFPALEQINEFTDHQIRVSYRKVGRVFRFIAFSFNAKDVKQAKIGRLPQRQRNAQNKLKRGKMNVMTNGRYVYSDDG